MIKIPLMYALSLEFMSMSLSIFSKEALTLFAIWKF